jgi:myo-inositol 2-dehydrogenase / D-chiro-inositol 1-dehydrogenase
VTDRRSSGQRYHLSAAGRDGSLNVAVIGAGRIGAVHAASVAGHRDARLVLVADPFTDAATTLAARHGARATGRTEDVYEAPDVDAVVICSPTPLHVDQIIASIHAGKAVLCEKPVDLTMERVDECLAAIAGQEHRVMIGFNRRFDPSIAEIHARVRTGEIGPVEQLTIVSRDAAPPPLAYLATSGGLFRDMTIHDLDTAAHLLGEIVEVRAVGQRTDPATVGEDDVDAAVVLLTAASGAVATIHSGRHCASGYDQRMEVFGPLGSLVMANPTRSLVEHHGSDRTGAVGPYPSDFVERYADAYRRELDHFLRCVAAGVAPVPGVGEGRTALLLADAATRSAATGEPVRVDTSAAAVAAPVVDKGGVP